MSFAVAAAANDDCRSLSVRAGREREEKEEGKDLGRQERGEREGEVVGEKERGG